MWDLTAKQILGLLLLSKYILVEGWTYQGPRGRSDWGEVYSDCEGTHQSPININIEEANTVELGEITFHNYGQLGEHVELINNGHTIEFIPKEDSPYISSNMLFAEYYFLHQFHFHWGKKGLRGSEHTIDGKKFSLELHAVHKNSDSSKILVIAYLFEEVPDNDIHHDVSQFNLGDFLGYFNATMVHSEGNMEIREHVSQDITKNIFDYDEINDDTGNLRAFCTYEGSLTTPPCSENVTWILDMHFREISKTAMNFFHSQVDRFENPLDNNFRNLQKLNGRHVSCSGLSSDKAESLHESKSTDSFAVQKRTLLLPDSPLGLAVVQPACVWPACIPWNRWQWKSK